MPGQGAAATTGGLIQKALKALSLPVQLFASTEDKILPSVDECRRLARRLGNARVTTLQASGHCPLLEGEVSLADLLEKAELTRRAPAKRKDYIADFVPPTAEAVRNATERLAGVRKATSPVFVSTLDDGRRVSGLRGLPPLDTKKPTLFVGNHQLYGFLDLPLVVEEVLNERLQRDHLSGCLRQAKLCRFSTVLQDGERVRGTLLHVLHGFNTDDRGHGPGRSAASSELAR